MSLALNPIRPVKIIDPVLDFKDENVYGVLIGGKRTSFKPIISTSYSNSSATFSAPPPNPRVAVSRKVKLVCPVTFTFQGTAPDGQGLLQSGFDAPRAYPLSSVMNTLQIDLNNTSFTINMSDTIQALLRYHNPDKLKNGDMSMSPSTMDKSQQYSDLANSIHNPLGAVIDAALGGLDGRGAFPCDNFTNAISSDPAAIIESVATYTFTEDLFLSPMLFGTCCEDTGFIGLQTMQVIVNWANDLSRMWCHDDSGGSVLSSISVQLGQPTLLFEYKSPNDIMKIPDYRHYGYYEIQRYPTERNQVIQPQTATIINSNNIQLNSIPRMIYVYVRRRNSDRTFLTTDCFLSIERISINWANQSGLLSNASKQDLYEMSKRNGCNLNWRDWSGEAAPFWSGGTNESIHGTGSVLAIEFGTDISLNIDEAPGVNGTYQLQIDLTCTNRAGLDINPAMYIVVSNEGSFTIENNSAYSQVGVLSRKDVLDAQSMEGINYGDLKYMAGAGSFKSFGRKLRRTLKMLAKHAPGIIKEGTKAYKQIAPLVQQALASGGSLPVQRKRRPAKRKSSSVYL
jgi:hypothetical protein